MMRSKQEDDGQKLAIVNLAQILEDESIVYVTKNGESGSACCVHICICWVVARSSQMMEGQSQPRQQTQTFLG